MIEQLKIKVGVTGTREGATNVQLKAVLEFMESLGPDHELHHGDCRGVDEEVVELAKYLGWRIVCHPPASDYLRAHTKYDEIREPLGYLERDRNIVDETDFLIVVPFHNEWQPKGGTWYTHDYAKKMNKLLQVFYPGVK